MSLEAKAKILRNMVQAKIPKKTENTLVVIRHGATALNNDSDEKFRGWADIPLSTEGKEQAKATGVKLMGTNIKGIVTSDLGRTLETAKIISEITGIPILQESKGLRPWHLGDLTGQLVKPNLPALEAYIKNPKEVVPGGESFNTFKKRMIDTILDIQKKYPKDKIAIVTHHRGERLIKSWIDAGRPTDSTKLSHEPFLVKGIKPGEYTNYEIPPK